MLLSYVLLFSYLLCYLVFSICSYTSYYLCTLFFCTSCFPFTHTLIMVAFWRPWVCTSSYWTIVSNVQVFDETARLARSLGPLPLILVYLHFILVIIPWFLYITFDFYSAVIFFLLFIAIMCGLICITAVFMIICFRFIACSGYNLGLARIQGVLYLAYMRRHNVSVSIGSGRYRVVSEPRFDIKGEPSSYL